MSEVKVNKISPRTNCGTVTLGDSGDTFTIPAGASIINNGTATGFGRTGTVNWDTTKKTTGFTAVNGVGYFCDTTSAAFTMTLPATPTAGDIVALKDYANTFDTNNLTIGRNGSNIEGAANNYTVSTEGISVTLLYVDATRGWSVINSGDDSNIAPQALFVAATGGTVTTCGNYKIHSFTGPGTFTVSCAGNASGSNSVEYLVVAGGGGGGTSNSGGGGGAGGFRQNYPSPTIAGLPVTAQAYPITVGGGGAGGPPGPAGNGRGSSGNNSIFSSITSAGGGGGGSGEDSPSNPNGIPGGSGGGAGPNTSPPPAPSTGGTGNSPPVAPPQGNDGGIAQPQSSTGASGGGASAVGGNGGPGTPGTTVSPGGAGTATSISGSSVTYSGGGGGGIASGVGGTAGSGGSGNPGGSGGNGSNGGCGTTNRGGGGGGSGRTSGVSNNAGGAGGSGIVIIRYKFQ